MKKIELKQEHYLLLIVLIASIISIYQYNCFYDGGIIYKVDYKNYRLYQCVWVDKLDYNTLSYMEKWKLRIKDKDGNYIKEKGLGPFKFINLTQVNKTTWRYNVFYNITD